MDRGIWPVPDGSQDARQRLDVDPGRTIAGLDVGQAAETRLRLLRLARRPAEPNLRHAAMLRPGQRPVKPRNLL